jgi:hypothetical protein
MGFSYSTFLEILFRHAENDYYGQNKTPFVLFHLADFGTVQVYLNSFTNILTLRSLSYELIAVKIFVLSFSVCGIKTYAYCIMISTAPDFTVSGISIAGTKAIVTFHENYQSLI